jgi:hypothetical protein
MVKIGIIVEGDGDKLVLDSPAFQAFLAENKLELASDVINLRGKSNLKPKKENVQDSVQILFDQGAEWIIILRDMDDASSFEAVVSEVFQAPSVKLCLAVKEFEAWFLADSVVLKTLLKLDHFEYSTPEEPLKPGKVIADLFLQHTGRGIGWDKTGAKLKLANRMIRNGFTIEAAARHPNCSSAQYFLTTLTTLATAN